MNHRSHSGVFNLPQCPAFSSITVMCPQRLTTRHISETALSISTACSRWRKRRRKNRFQKEGRSWTARACERLWERSAASARRCPSPTIPPPALAPAKRGRSALFRSPHRALACSRERPGARGSASRGKCEGRWWKGNALRHARLVEARPDAGAQFGSQPRAIRPGKPALPVHAITPA